MPDVNEIRAAARQVVAEMTGRRLADGEFLVSSGLLDSLSVLRLISRLEVALSIEIPPDHLQPEDFDTVDYIVDTVQRVAAVKA